MSKEFPIQGNAKMNDDNELLVNSSGVNLAIVNKEEKITIGGGVANDTKLVGIIITTALTGTIAITGFADSDGTATNLIIPASTSAGEIDFGSALNSAGALTITCSNQADRGNVIVKWLAV